MSYICCSVPCCCLICPAEPNHQHQPLVYALRLPSTVSPVSIEVPNRNLTNAKHDYKVSLHRCGHNQSLRQDLLSLRLRRCPHLYRRAYSLLPSIRLNLAFGLCWPVGLPASYLQELQMQRFKTIKNVREVLCPCARTPILAHCRRYSTTTPLKFRHNEQFNLHQCVDRTLLQPWQRLQLPLDCLPLGLP